MVGTGTRTIATESPPGISVIIPCYNAADTVTQTLASLRAQSRTAWEAICVDDGSTDGTTAVLAELAAFDARIRPMRVSHAGLAASRNRGLPHARAERVFFLDADDLIRPDALAALVQASQACGDRCVITAGFELLDQSRRPLGVVRFPSVPGLGVDPFLRANRLLSTALVPKALLGADPCDATLPACEDWDLWLRLAHAGVRFVTVPRVLFGYRLRHGSLSHKAEAMYTAGRRVLDRWLPHARNPEQVGDVRHIWACTCGALALASNAPHAVDRFFHDLPPLEPGEDFCRAAAGGIEWALLVAHGAAGRTWHDHSDEWLVEIEAWLRQGPLATCSDPILTHLAQLTRDPGDHAERVRRLLRRRPKVRRILVYGLGTHGLPLVERLRFDQDFGRYALCVADDFADPLTFDLLGLAREDPRRWTAWPSGTVAVIAANQHQAMQATLRRAGGRVGWDFLALAPAGTPTSACLRN